MGTFFTALSIILLVGVLVTFLYVRKGAPLETHAVFWTIYAPIQAFSSLFNAITASVSSKTDLALAHGLLALAMGVVGIAALGLTLTRLRIDRTTLELTQNVLEAENKLLAARLEILENRSKVDHQFAGIVSSYSSPEPYVSQRRLNELVAEAVKTEVSRQLGPVPEPEGIRPDDNPWTQPPGRTGA